MHTHNDYNSEHWWKVQFDRRVFVKKVRVVNRSCCHDRIDYADLVTIVVNGNSRTDTVCANVGVLGASNTFDCDKEADEFKIVQPVGKVAMNLAEVYIYGTACNV